MASQSDFIIVDSSNGSVKAIRIADIQSAFFNPKGSNMIHVIRPRGLKIDVERGKNCTKITNGEDWTCFYFSQDDRVDFFGKDARRAIDEFKIAVNGHKPDLPPVVPGESSPLGIA